MRDVFLGQRNLEAEAQRPSINALKHAAQEQRPVEQPNMLVTQGTFLTESGNTYQVAGKKVFATSSKGKEEIYDVDCVRLTSGKNPRLELFQNGKCILTSSTADRVPKTLMQIENETPQLAAKNNAMVAAFSAKRTI